MNRHYARVEIPSNADGLLGLAALILQKHHQDEPNSLLPFDWMDQLQQKTQIALQAHTLQQELDRRKEKYNEERNLILGVRGGKNSYIKGTIRYFVFAVRDILLGRYRGSERTLGDWGFTVSLPKGSVRVLIPTNADELLALAKLILQKHKQDGSNSLLQKLDWAQFTTLLYEAEKALEEGRKCSRDKEKATQIRNQALGIDKGQTTKTPHTVKYLIISIRDLLLGIFRGAEHALGSWGFEVNTHLASSARKGKVQADKKLQTV